MSTKLFMQYIATSEDHEEWRLYSPKLPLQDTKDIKAKPVYGNLFRWLFRRPKYWKVTTAFQTKELSDADST